MTEHPHAAGVPAGVGVPTARVTVTVAALGTTVAMLAYTAPLGALPTIATDLGAGPSAQSWILSAMSLGFTTALLTAGSLGDDHGRRRVFVLGALAVASASLLGAAAPTSVVFVAGRLLQGVGAAALIACSLALLSHVVPPGPARAVASGVWGAGLAAGIGLGPLLAVFLPWRLAYAVVATAALVVAVVATRVVTESRASEPKALDLPGIVLLAGGLALVCAGLTQGRQGVDPLSAGLVVGGLLALVGFLLVEHRSAAPMMPLPLFRSAALVAATLGALGAGLGVISVVSYFSTLAQRGLGLSPAVAALTITAWPAFSVATSLLTRHLPEHLSGAVRLVAGLAVTTGGLLLLLHLTTTTSPVRPVLAFVVAGIGTGVVNATLGREAVASVPAALAGVGSGINNTSRYLGAAVGVTLVAVLTGGNGTESPAQLLRNWDHALLVAIGLSLLCVVAVAVAESRRRGVAGPTPGAGRTLTTGHARPVRARLPGGRPFGARRPSARGLLFRRGAVLGQVEDRRPAAAVEALVGRERGSGRRRRGHRRPRARIRPPVRRPWRRIVGTQVSDPAARVRGRDRRRATRAGQRSGQRSAQGGRGDDALPGWSRSPTSTWRAGRPA